MDETATRLEKPSLKTLSSNHSTLIKVTRSKLNHRIQCLDLDSDKLELFFSLNEHITIRDLEFIPYNRFLVAKSLDNIFDHSLQHMLKQILTNHQKGAISISVRNVTQTKKSFILFSTALSHLLGRCNLDLLSGKYYATFTIGGEKDASINLLRPYDNFKMHTDGAFMLEPTDWLMMTKLEEENAVGGETRILHMEDWEDFNYFYQHQIGKNPFSFSGPKASDSRAKSWGNHRETDSLEAPILHISNVGKSIRFVDQFIHPRNIEEASYLSDIQNSLEQSNQVTQIEIPVGSLLIINNYNWVHGRNKFLPNQQLKRELMRQRGVFYG